MAYRIFLTDGIDTAEMDTENIDTKTIFALLDLQDIGSKKNDIQTLTFKGTKKNNEAFGSFFDFSRESNVSFTNNLFFNYNPLKAVKTYVYEDTELIFIGDLRLTEINVDVNGVVIYNCVVATKLTLLKTALSDKYMADLDFTDLRHRYCWPNISGWNIKAPGDIGSTDIEIYDVDTDTYSTIEAEYGTGYVYPLIDYGFRFEGTGTASYSGATISQKNMLNLNNFKAAIFLKEYLNRIFSQDVLDGFTYEIKGSPIFLQQFNQVIIPETNEDVTTPLFDIDLQYFPDEEPTVQTVNRVDLFTGRYYTEYISLLDIYSPTPPYYFQLTNGDNFLKALRNITSSVKLKFDYSITTSNYTSPTNIMYVSFRINKTSNAESYNPVNGTLNILNTIADITIPINWVAPTTYTGTSEIIIDNFSINRDEYLLANVSYTMINPISSAFSVILTNTISNMSITFPGRTGDTFNILSIPSSACTESTDIVAPKPPVNVKQLDFLKSVINQFNFVVYTLKDNYKHFIFELYDDFYAKTTPQNLITNSVDWTNKIDYTRGLQIKPNIELPKSYLYTYKSDIDVLNAKYKTKYNEIYGQFSFNDELGLVGQKKVELLFAPTPIASINNIELPLYYKVDSDNSTVRTTKIVPRIIYYNGYDNYNNVSNSNYYVAYQPIKTGSTNPTISILQPLFNYPNCSNYYYKTDDPFYIVQSVPSNDIHFNQPKEIYFQNVNNLFNNLPNSYTNYFINQVTELTDENVIFVECDVYLTEFDINNLDLSVPVYIQTGNNNGAYFKIINVEYENKDLPSKVKLQKIVI